MAKLHEIYGLPENATTEEINEAACKHAAECAKGMHGSVLPERDQKESRKWDQARSCWVDEAPVVLCPGCGKPNQYADDDGYTDEFPREWHADCARAAVEAGNDPCG